MKLDILAFGAHPDDVELGAGGTIAKHCSMGYKVGIVDLTDADLSTRGTVELRKEEAQKAGEALGVAYRSSLGFRDGFFTLDEVHKLKVVSCIREHQPDLIIAPAVTDRHPDHGRAAQLVREANFLSGLAKVETTVNSQIQGPWRAASLIHYVQFEHLEPDFLVDIGGFWEQKEAALMAYRSQFYDPESEEPETIIAKPEFMGMIRGRLNVYGGMGQIAEAEGFVNSKKMVVQDLIKSRV